MSRCSTAGRSGSVSGCLSAARMGRGLTSTGGARFTATTWLYRPPAGGGAPGPGGLAAALSWSGHPLWTSCAPASAQGRDGRGRRCPACSATTPTIPPSRHHHRRPRPSPTSHPPAPRRPPAPTCTSRAAWAAPSAAGGPTSPRPRRPPSASASRAVRCTSGYPERLAVVPGLQRTGCAGDAAARRLRRRAALPVQQPPSGGFDLFGEGRGCNQLKATFAVDEVTYLAGQLQSVSIRFVQRWEVSGPPLYGAFRWQDRPDRRRLRLAAAAAPALRPRVSTETHRLHVDVAWLGKIPFGGGHTIHGWQCHARPRAPRLPAILERSGGRAGRRGSGPALVGDARPGRPTWAGHRSLGPGGRRLPPSGRSSLNRSAASRAEGASRSVATKRERMAAMVALSGLCFPLK